MKTKLIPALILTVLLSVFAGCSKEALPEPQKPTTQTLELQVSLTFGDGDTKPVASRKFFVLRKGVDSMMREIGYEKFGVDRNSTYFLSYTTLRAGDKALTESWNPMHEQFAKLFQSNVAAEIETDMNGKAVVTIKPGAYWIYGMAEMRQNRVYWDWTVFVGDSPKTVALNANNGNGKPID